MSLDEALNGREVNIIFEDGSRLDVTFIESDNRGILTKKNGYYKFIPFDHILVVNEK